MKNGAEGAKPVAVENEDRINVLIVDDHPMVRDGIRSLLTSDPRFEVVGEASDGRSPDVNRMTAGRSSWPS